MQRSSANERLGLTLCYETDEEDGQTDIFIDDIHPDGLAALDGRLKLGDQIIQVGIGALLQAKHESAAISLITSPPPKKPRKPSSCAPTSSTSELLTSFPFPD